MSAFISKAKAKTIQSIVRSEIIEKYHFDREKDAKQ